MNLTTLATVKAELGIADHSQDENLARWIAQASDAIATYCNREFESESRSQTFRPKRHRRRLMLGHWPAVITAITENGVDLTLPDYEYDEDDGSIMRLCSGVESYWPPATTGIVVEYTSGYESIVALPDGIERAAVVLVKQYHSSSDRDPRLRSESIDGAGAQSYTDDADKSGLSVEVEGLLRGHVLPPVL